MATSSSPGADAAEAASWGKSELLRYIESEPPLVSVYEEVCSRADGDPGHDVAHCLRVALWTLRLAGPSVSPKLVVAAALLHDVVNMPKDSPHRERASELSAEVGEGLLPALGFSVDEVDEICGAIRDHSFSRGATPDTPLGRALQDADRLEALGAIGIFRTIATGVRMGGLLFDPEDPWARRRDLDDSRYAVDHFFRKLLRLHDRMLTDAGRDEAKRRTVILLEFLKELGAELGEPLPAAQERDTRRPPPP